MSYLAKNKKLKAYWPLVCLILIALLGAFALAHGADNSFAAWMHYFMGLFFCEFAMLKLFDLQGFSKGFQMYDLVAQKFPLYALLYPLIELGLGLAYLSFFYPLFTYLVTVIVMFIGSIGVVKALRKGLNVKCACMGTILSVPLSTVTLSEDIGMGILSCLMLIFALI